MSVTLFKRVDDTVVITIQQSRKIIVGDQQESSIAYRDGFVNLKIRTIDERNLVIAYQLKWKPLTNGSDIVLQDWWCAIVYRPKHPNGETIYYPEGRPFKVVYEDDWIRLFRYGEAQEKPDYLLVGLHPPLDQRHGDVRFSTAPVAHQIEKPMKVT